MTLRFPSPARACPRPPLFTCRRLLFSRVKGALPYAEGMLEEQKKRKDAAEAAAAAGGGGGPLETKKTK